MDLTKLVSEGNFQEIIRYFSNRPLVEAKDFLALSIAMYNLGFENDVKKVIEAGLSKFPDDLDLLINASEIFYHYGDLGRAFELSRRVLRRGLKDPYIFDIVASYYSSEKLEQLATLFAEKAYNLLRNINGEESEKIKNKYKLTPNFRKKLFILGAFGNYCDSLIKFVENGWELYVLEIPGERFSENYEILLDMGAQIINVKDLESYSQTNLKEIDVFFCSVFFNEQDLEDELKASIEKINYFYRISAILKENKLKAEIVLNVAGNFYVSQEYWKTWLSKRLVYVDWILFETENLKKFFLNNIIVPPSVKTGVILVQSPLKENVKIKFYDTYLCKVVFLGTQVPQDSPIPPVLISEIFRPIPLTNESGIIELKKNRDIFERIYGDFAFALTKNYSHHFHSHYEEVQNSYRISEDLLGFLQFGIIPILPKNSNDFYHKLCDKGMAICLKSNIEYFDPTLIDNNLISSMRKNILENLELFTFDKFYNFIEQILLGSENGG